MVICRRFDKSMTYIVIVAILILCFLIVQSRLFSFVGSLSEGAVNEPGGSSFFLRPRPYHSNHVVSSLSELARKKEEYEYLALESLQEGTVRLGVLVRAHAG